MSEVGEESVFSHRERVLKSIKEGLKLAFDNPKSQHEVVMGGGTRESLREADQNRNAIDSLTDDQEIVFARGDSSGEVLVSNPHDYPILLKEAAREFKERTGAIVVNLDYGDIHELKHHVPGLDQPGLTIKYGVEILKDAITGRLNLRSKIVLEGKIMKGLYKDILAAPDQLSVTDKRTIQR